MNEQIRELQVQATAYADSIVPASNRYNDIYYSIVQGKLAELIVNACADLFPHQFTDEKYQRRIDRTIKKHFGIDP